MSIRSGDIRDQSWKLSEIAPKFGRFFSPSQILEGEPSKGYTHFITIDSQHVAWKKFCENTPTSPEVIGAHKLNFRPNFKFSRLNFLREAPSQLWCAPASVGQSVRRVKNLRRQHPQGPKCSLPNNVHLGGSIWAPITLLFVDQSSPNFFHPTWNRLQLIKYFSDLRYVDPFRRYSRSKLKVVKSRAEFWTFFALPNVRGQVFQNLYPFYHPWLAAHRLEKVLWRYFH